MQIPVVCEDKKMYCAFTKKGRAKKMIVITLLDVKEGL